MESKAILTIKHPTSAEQDLQAHCMCSHQPSLHYSYCKGQYRAGNEDIGLPGVNVISEAVAMTTHSERLACIPMNGMWWLVKHCHDNTFRKASMHPYERKAILTIETLHSR